MSIKKSYRCSECGLHYKDKATMEKCTVWCTKYKSCNLEIARLSIEVGSQKK